jgi:oxygen-independent coproporphyrinogen-3 oxidase
VKKALGERDIALYVGIPFCPTRCHYCSFVSHSVEKSMKLVGPFLDTLLQEIVAFSKTVQSLGLNIISVYIGGGTPTTLDPGGLSLLMRALESSFDLVRVRDYTVEAGRPDTVTHEKLSVLRQNGATRASVNPQSMSDDVLRAIGRHHTARDVGTALEAARSAGFDVINMDLIAGLPGDTPAGFRQTLAEVLSLQPENIPVHTLALKKGTKVTLDRTVLPGAADVSIMLDAAGQLLRENGYVPYYLYRQKFMSGGFENVGWCRPGTENLYNVLIMEELTTILALGGGGVTKWSRRKAAGSSVFSTSNIPMNILRIPKDSRKNASV